jgi:hypothetical protein
MDLQAKINDKFAELVDEGYVDKMIKETLQGTIKSIIQSSLRDWSDFGKQLEKHISEGMGVNLKRLNLDHYNDIVLRVVQEELAGTVLETAQESIRKRVQSVLGTLEKKEWKLSEIVAKFREKVIDSIGAQDGELGLEAQESEYGGWVINLDEDANEDGGIYSTRRSRKPSYKYKYRLFLDKDGQVYSFLINGKRPDFTKETASRFDDFFFQLYASGVTVLVDEDDCVLEYQEPYN